MNHYGVIMAGGGGTRFWPLSRQKKPKQLLNLSGKDLMVNEAVDRMATIIGKSNIFVVTSELQVSSMMAATAGKVFPMNILAEPSARNTAACIGYSAMEIYRKYGDGVMVITPSDHYVKNVPALTEIFRKAILAAEEQDKLITIGIKPSFPATGFGYIKCDLSADGDLKQVVDFREKPNKETASIYIKQGEYVWNSGIFIWKASLILKKIKEYAPDIYEDLSKIGESMNTPSEQEVLHNIYPQIRSISIDYAVMEPCASNGEVMVIHGDFGWNDIGSWDMMNILYKADNQNNVMIGDVIAIDTKDTVIYSESKTVTAIDVENIVIVETSDAVMVCRKDNAQNVKKIVEMLTRTNRTELL